MNQTRNQALTFLSSQRTAGAIKWVPESKTLQLPCRCVDGRWQEPIQGLLGGSSGEVMRQIIAYLLLLPTSEQRESARRIKQAIPMIIETVQEDVPFCVHSDTHATRTKLGCGYLNLVWHNHTAFHLPEGSIVRELVTTFAKCKCDSDDDTLLEGDHAELGAIVIDWEGNAVPHVTPWFDGTQFFVYHPRVGQLLREKILQDLLPVFANITGTTVESAPMNSVLRKLTDEHVYLTLDALAPGKPVIQATLSRSGETVDVQ